MHDLGLWNASSSDRGAKALISQEFELLVPGSLPNHKPLSYHINSFTMNRELELPVQHLEVTVCQYMDKITRLKLCVPKELKESLRNGDTLQSHGLLE